VRTPTLVRAENAPSTKGIARKAKGVQDFGDSDSEGKEPKTKATVVPKSQNAFNKLPNKLFMNE